jgi:DNA-binding phage protein
VASADNPYGEELRNVHQGLEGLLRRRDELIREAASAGVQPTVIARDAGLSRAHIYRIING